MENINISEETSYQSSIPAGSKSHWLMWFGAIVVVIVIFWGYTYYSRAGAEKAIIAYACKSDVIEKTTLIIEGARSGVNTQNFGQQTMEDLYAKGLRMAQEAIPVGQEIKTHPELEKHQRYFNKILKKNDKEKSDIYLTIAQKIYQSCPEKSSDLRMTGEAVAMIMGSFKE